MARQEYDFTIVMYFNSSKEANVLDIYMKSPIV